MRKLAVYTALLVLLVGGARNFCFLLLIGDHVDFSASKIQEYKRNVFLSYSVWTGFIPYLDSRHLR